MQLTRDRAERYVRLSSWLIKQLTAAAPWGVAGVLVSGLLARLFSLASFAGTFHIAATMVISRLRDREIDLPVLSDLAEAAGVQSHLSVALAAIALIFAGAAFFEILNRRLTTDTTDVGVTALMKDLLKARISEEAGKEKSDEHRRQYLKKFARNQFQWRSDWAKIQVNLVLSIAQNGLVFCACLGLLAFFVPMMTFILIPIFAGFFVLSAPVIYRRGKRSEVALRNRRQDLIAERADLGDAFVESVQGGKPETFAETFLRSPSTHGLRQAERERDRVENLRTLLTMLLVLLAFCIVLVFLYVEVGELGLWSGDDIGYIILVLFTVRFTLNYFRTLIGGLFRFNDKFWQLQKLFDESAAT